MIRFSDASFAELKAIRAFLHARMYRHWTCSGCGARRGGVVQELFGIFTEAPELMPRGVERLRRARRDGAGAGGGGLHRRHDRPLRAAGAPQADRSDGQGLNKGEGDGQGASIEIRDPRFARLIHGSAGLDQLWTGGRWCEGPAYFPAGKYLVWSDIPNDRLMRWDETGGEVSVFESPCRHQNGHTVDRQGRLVACEHLGRCVSRIEPDGSRTVLADRFEGHRFNSPNDVVVKSDGSVWFTDPSYGIDSEYEGDAAPSRDRVVERLSASTRTGR